MMMTTVPSLMPLGTKRKRWIFARANCSIFTLTWKCSFRSSRHPWLTGILCLLLTNGCICAPFGIFNSNIPYVAEALSICKIWRVTHIGGPHWPSYTPENEHVPWKIVVGRLLSFWNGPFLADMLVFRDVSWKSSEIIIVWFQASFWMVYRISHLLVHHYFQCFVASKMQQDCLHQGYLENSRFDLVGKSWWGDLILMWVVKSLLNTPVTNQLTFWACVQILAAVWTIQY